MTTKFWLQAILATFLCGGSIATGSCIDWSGGYIGLYAGGGWANSHLKTRVIQPFGNLIVPGTLNYTAAQLDALTSLYASQNRLKPSGFVGGGQFGYLYSFNDCFLGGLEFDVGAFRFQKSKRGSILVPDPVEDGQTFRVHQKVHTNWLLTLRPRFCYNFGEGLIFATAGLAVTALHYDDFFEDNYLALIGSGIPQFEKVSKTQLKAGWTVGGGFEYAFCERFSVALTYLYTNFSHKPLETTGLLSTSDFREDVPSAYSEVDFQHRVKFDAHSVRVGVNWHFGCNSSCQY